jgi:RNA polymerase sigma factor (sigma-70 family)
MDTATGSLAISAPLCFPGMLTTNRVDQIVRLTRGLSEASESAFLELHTEWAPRLYRYLYTCSRGDATAASECLQDTMIRVARYARPFDDEDAFWKWLCLMARQTLVNRWKANCRYVPLEQDERVVPTRGLPPDLADALQRAIGELDETEKSLLRDYYWEDDSQDQIGEKLGLSRKAVESRLARLRDRLKIKIREILQS